MDHDTFLAELDAQGEAFQKFMDPSPRWILEDGLSYSGLSLWLNCREQFRLAYIEGWKALWRNKKAADFGTMFHLLLEHNIDPTEDEGWYACRALLLGDDPDADIDEVMVHKALALWIGYWRYYSLEAQDTSLIQWEKEFYFDYEFSYKGKDYKLPLYGFIDRLDWNPAKREGWVGDTKTRDDLDIQDTEGYLRTDLQTQMYYLAHEHMYGCIPRGVVYDLVRRPRQAPKLVSRKSEERESLIAYHNRLVDEVNEAPKSFFHRIYLQRSSQAFEQFRESVLHPIFADFLTWFSRLESNNFKKIDYINPVAVKTLYGPCDLFNLVTYGSHENLTREAPKRREATRTPKFGEQVLAKGKGKAPKRVLPVQDPGVRT